MAKVWSARSDGFYQRKGYGGRIKVFCGNLNKNGRAFGDGTLKVYKGDLLLRQYVGEFKNDLSHGYGEMITYTDTGDTLESYRGEWRRGLPCGRGEYRREDGIVHKGIFSYGKPSGYGDRVFPDGNIRRRRCQFKPKRIRLGRKRSAADVEDAVYVPGPTEVWCSDGDYLAGFLDAELTGTGVYRFAADADGKLDEYQGDLVCGVSSGRGLLKYRGGGGYTGAFANDEPHGHGVLRRPDGSVFSGRMERGREVSLFSPARARIARAIAGAARGRGSRRWAAASLYMRL